MDIAVVRELFDRTLRAHPLPVDGIEWTWCDGVLRSSQPDHHSTISWWDFAADRAAAIVAREAARVRSIGGQLSWPVYGHDRPEGLDLALRDAVFEDRFGLERFLAIEAPTGARLERPAGVDVRPVRGQEELLSYLAVARNAYDDEWYASPQAQEFYLRQLPASALFLAYVDGQPAATGRLAAPKDCPMLGLYDASVLPEHRGKGLYRALVAERAAEAARRGARYLYTNAWETSRPILERLGFEQLTTRHVWTLKAASPTESP